MARLVLDEPGVDVGVVGCVPLTPALATLRGVSGGGPDAHRPDSVVSRMIRLWRETEKAWVAVVDAGALYDPMAEALGREGVPTFRSADRAVGLLGAYCRWRACRKNESSGGGR